MKQIEANENLIASCGLYCGCCKAYLSEKCLGCKDNVKAEKWCKIKTCCKEKNIKSCANCDVYTKVADLKNCKKFNNFISKIFTFLFRSDKYSCINKIKEVGDGEYTKVMAKSKKYNSCK